MTNLKIGDRVIASNKYHALDAGTIDITGQTICSVKFDGDKYHQACFVKNVQLADSPEVSK